MAATVLVSKPAKRATPWSSWTTMSPVRRSADDRKAPRRAAPSSGRSARRRRQGAGSGGEAALGDDRQLEGRGDEALAQAGHVEAQRALGRHGLGPPLRAHVRE